MKGRLGLVIAGVLAFGVIAAVATVVQSGSLDPPGPPAPTGPIQVQVVPGIASASEYTTVIVGCGDGSTFGQQVGATSAIAQLNGLGANGWSLVGPPDVSVVTTDTLPAGRCTMTYTLHRAAGSGSPVPTWTPATTPTPTFTATPPTQTPTNTPVPPTSTLEPLT
jgi:hypothetical protein